ncbi:MULTISPECIES: PucR family transcriptional regulator [Virgibacillus]|uniref:Leucine-rich protein n=1 Tax=Virgibacillus dokdonensis TaxID=302167 RepID=A0A2K9J7Y4_9BACI|nr:MULTISPECIES: helix-turn-helix domain-containing protein [Virgibacillus]AUJ25700.1 Leucine-rich protein [Virgibacillus dokdonensis]NWO13420.1 helix-turn-helix domain-containing protein [Virgibacillus sp.]
MNERLKKIFPNLIVEPKDASPTSTVYKWFLLQNGTKVGIPKQDLTDKDIHLLATFLTPYRADLPHPTKKEIRWQSIVQQSIEHVPTEPLTSYRFVYFSMKEKQIEPLMFKESVQTLFNYEIAILWKNRNEGVFIEEKMGAQDESIPYEQIIDVLMNDLSVNIRFLVGPYLNSYQQASDQYMHILAYAKTAFKYAPKAVLKYQEALPYILLEQTDDKFQHHLSEVALQEFATDKDFLQTIRTFLQCNLNISVTAKKLYMHRNSLQYRIDKFIEKTGIDLRQFHEAVTVYFALLANMHKDE